MKIYNKTKQAIIAIRNCLYKPLNYINCKLSGVEFSGDLKVNGLLHLKNNGEICIGQKVRINSSRENNINFNGDRTYLCTSNGKIVIGNEVGISNTVIYSENKIVIDAVFFCLWIISLFVILAAQQKFQECYCILHRYL